MPKKFPQISPCNICPRECGADRYTARGYCGANDKLEINLAQLHFGEEPAISGSKGSGTIFLAHCNLKCVFCQNYKISHHGWGSEASLEDLAEMMLGLASDGAHNINFVSPAHYRPQIIESIKLAKAAGLRIPIVWNTNAYESISGLKELEGLVDIYLPDLKYGYKVHSSKYSLAGDYPEVALKAITEMHRQVGYLQCGTDGIAKRGLIVRLLVLPNDLAGIKRSLNQLADAIGTQTQLSLMAQYYPIYKAEDYPEINRGISREEYDAAVADLCAIGFENAWIQELSCSSEWTPDFKEIDEKI